MQKIATYIYKGIRKIFIAAYLFISKLFTWIIFYGNNIKFKDFRTSGIPFVSIALGAECEIGKNFRMNNGNIGNPIGRPQRCLFFVDKGASLKIGDNVGISSTAIVVYQNISIGNNVKIGGGVCIYDTDFHSLDPHVRVRQEEDFEQKKKKPVVIGDNVFIGAHTTILKGVTIGNNSVIGASSVVTKSIPANEIWAGNPAKLIKKMTVNG